MPGPEPPGTAEPRKVSILSQGPYLIVSIHTALDDSQITRLERDLIDLVGSKRSRGIILDVSTLDVLDSFATRTLDRIAQVARLRGAETVVVGIAPEVAIAMVRLELQMDFAHTALDLEEGLDRLHELTMAASNPQTPGAHFHGR
jgi:rsbT antagonist protein RsbS